jgi:hypothetical protein
VRPRPPAAAAAACLPAGLPACSCCACAAQAACRAAGCAQQLCRVGPACADVPGGIGGEGTRRGPSSTASACSSAQG